MPFLQLIEFQTDRIDEFDVAVDERPIASAGWRTATRAMRTQIAKSRGPTCRSSSFPHTTRRWRTPTDPKPDSSPSVWLHCALVRQPFETSKLSVKTTCRKPPMKQHYSQGR